MRILQLYTASFLISISIVFLIIYASLFSLGYSFFDYVQFISRRIEIHLMWIGIILLKKALKKKGKKDEIFKRRIAKFR